MHAVRPTGSREFITIGGRPVATLSADPSRVNRLQASSSVGMPSLEVLAGVVATDPSGVVIIRYGSEGVAFALEKGRVVGAFGSGPRGSMQAWAQAARTQEIQQASAGSDRTGMGLVRMFIERCILDHLPLTHEVGSVLSVLRGDVKWTGTTLPGEQAPSLQHLLMELARESDDCSHVERRLQPLSRLVVPVSPPLHSAEEGEGSFADLADGADETQHQVHWAVWTLCDRRTSLDTIAQRSVFGRAPTLRALDELRRRGCVAFMDAAPDLPEPPPPRPVPSPGSVVPVAVAPPAAAPIRATAMPPVPAEVGVMSPSQPDVEPIEIVPARRTGALVAVLACLGLAGGLWVAVDPSSGQPPGPDAVGAQAVASASEPAAASAPAVRVAAPEPLPTDIDELRAMSLPERHALLAVAGDDIAVEDHVALDLLQSVQSPAPCRTFADALSTIEASGDRSAYAWALQEAEAPTGDAEACEGLQRRISELRGDEPAARAPTRRARPRRAPVRRQREVEPQPDPEPVTELKTKPDPIPAPEPEPQRSVASKLDDDGLRALK